MRRILFAAALLSSTAAATKYPLTITDDLGRTITLNKSFQSAVKW